MSKFAIDKYFERTEKKNSTPQQNEQAEMLFNAQKIKIKPKFISIIDCSQSNSKINTFLNQFFYRIFSENYIRILARVY